jgi:hypothetical protein
LNIDKGKMIRIAVIALLSLSIMIAGQYLYTRFSVEKSLISKLSQRPYVNHVELIKETGRLRVSLELKDVDNISDTWNEIYSITNKHLRNQAFSLDISGNPDALIEELYNKEIQFYLYEAIQTGNYSKMRSSLNEIESAEDATIKVFIDARILFLHIQRGEYYQYKVIDLS